MAAFDASADLQRDTDYFRAKIGGIDTAAQLVADRRLRKVALGAFGLQDDIDNRYFIRKVLEGGTIASDSLANKLSDSRYKELAKAFGFGDFATPRTRPSSFADEIVDRYNTRSFEVAVGEQDENLRLALTAQRELGEIAGDDGSDDTKWYRVMGSGPLHKVFEMALGLPSSFGQLDLDQQLSGFRAKATRQLGNGEISQFTEPAAVEKLVQRFLVRAQLADVQSASAGSIALALLQDATAGRG